MWHGDMCCTLDEWEPCVQRGKSNPVDCEHCPFFGAYFDDSEE